ncbi:hypothetical protein Tco_0700526 [Tanacetum coccineum]
MHQLQQMQDKANESCTISFRLLHSHLKALLNNDLKGTSIEGGFERAFATLFEQDVQTFTRTMFTFLYSRFSFDIDEGLMIRKYFIAYTKTDVPLFHDKLIHHMESLWESIQERAKHKQEYDRMMNHRMMQSKEGKVYSSKALDAGLVITESNETESERHVLSSKSGKDTHAEDADINSVNDKQPMAEVQLFNEHNIRDNEQQHSEQSESVYDTYVLEKVDRNTIPKSTDMSHRGGEIDQNADDENVNNKAKIKKEIEALETINIELEHSVAKLLTENEKLHKENKHLKQTYKDLYDSIKKTRVQTKDDNDSLIAKINSKTVENSNLKAQWKRISDKRTKNQAKTDKTEHGMKRAEKAKVKKLKSKPKP